MQAGGYGGVKLTYPGKGIERLAGWAGRVAADADLHVWG